MQKEHRFILASLIFPMALTGCGHEAHKVSHFQTTSRDVAKTKQRQWIAPVAYATKKAAPQIQAQATGKLPDNFFQTHTFDAKAKEIGEQRLDAKIFNLSNEEAVLITPGPKRGIIHPWFDGTTVYHMLASNPKKYAAFSKKWLTYVLNHLNSGPIVAGEIAKAGNYSRKDYPDCGGNEKIWDGTSFIHSYEMNNGKIEITRRQFESSSDDASPSPSSSSHTATDNWNGIVLQLAAEYYAQTGDAAWVKSRIKDLQRVANHYNYLTSHKTNHCEDIPLQSDIAILRSRPDSRVAYSSDSMLVYEQLMEYQEMLDKLGYSTEAAPIKTLAGKILNGIKKHLWDASGYYNVYIALKSNGEIKTPPFNWAIFYGDAVNNLYPSMWNIRSFSLDEQKDLYAKFMMYHARWAYGQPATQSAWSQIGLSSYAVGDKIGAAMHLANTTELFEQGDRQANTPGELGYYYALASKFSKDNPDLTKPSIIVVDDENSNPEHDGSWEKQTMPSFKTVGTERAAPKITGGYFHPHFGRSYLKSTTPNASISYRAWVPASKEYELHIIYSPDKEADSHVHVLVEYENKKLDFTLNQTQLGSGILSHKLTTLSLKEKTLLKTTLQRSASGKFATVDSIVIVEK